MMHTNDIKSGWELHTLANGHLSCCEDPSLLPEDIDRVEELLRPIFGKDMDREHIMVEYDNWSGVFKMQNVGFETGESDSIIEKIAEYLVRRKK